jgi:hypothetical protein
VPAVFSCSDIGIAAIVPPTPEVCDLVTLLHIVGIAKYSQTRL